MTIRHDSLVNKGDGPLVFAALGGFTCSICAPNRMTKLEVETFAATQYDGEWQSIDKSKLLGTGLATPNPCNIEPDDRTHWFMMWMPG
jgi:hypothetical protein